jgi:hypothetical protein
MAKVFRKSGSLALSNWGSTIKVICPHSSKKQVKLSIRNSGYCPVKVELRNNRKKILEEYWVLPKKSRTAVYKVGVKYVSMAATSPAAALHKSAQFRYTVEEV